MILADYVGLTIYHSLMRKTSNLRLRRIEGMFVYMLQRALLPFKESSLRHSANEHCYNYDSSWPYSLQRWNFLCIILRLLGARVRKYTVIELRISIRLLGKTLERHHTLACYGLSPISPLTNQNVFPSPTRTEFSIFAHALRSSAKVPIRPAD